MWPPIWVAGRLESQRKQLQLVATRLMQPREPIVDRALLARQRNSYVFDVFDVESREVDWARYGGSKAPESREQQRSRDAALKR
jgi:hypothetical protein